MVNYRTVHTQQWYKSNPEWNGMERNGTDGSINQEPPIILTQNKWELEIREGKPVNAGDSPIYSSDVRSVPHTYTATSMQ